MWAIVQAVGQVAAQDRPLPKFEDFNVTEVYKGPPAQPVLSSAYARAFRTRIREAAAKGPNFAGHYTIAQWGCGSTCVSIATINEKTGVVFDGPFSILGFGPFYKYVDVTDYSQMGLTFRTDSRLLIVRGCAEDEDCASFYYEWTGSKFKLLRKLLALPRKP